MDNKSLYNAHDYALCFQRGEERGFEWFFRQFYPALTLFANKIVYNKEVAEEIASTAFLKIWEKHYKFNRLSGIRSYLYQVVKNDSLKWLQKSNKQQAALDEITYLNRLASEKDHFQHLVSTELIRQLAAFKDFLPPQCSKVFQMLYVEGKSVKETARELNISVSTVRTQQKRGLNEIRERLGLACFFVICIFQFLAK
jgi:RNA polymerase sigma-70 factor (ECF subfamily)